MTNVLESSSDPCVQTYFIQKLVLASDGTYTQETVCKGTEEQCMKYWISYASGANDPGGAHENYFYETAQRTWYQFGVMAGV